MEKKTNEKPNFITNFSFNIKNAILKHILIPASSEKPKNNIHGTGRGDSQSTIEGDKLLLSHQMTRKYYKAYYYTLHYKK